MPHPLAFQAPEGSNWLLFGVGAALVLGPIVATRLRLPSIIGLLAGGLVIGPKVLGIVPATDDIVPALGQLGLLYLMFGAGVELDLALLRRVRRSAVTFGLTTFACPMVLGFGAGLLLDYSPPAALLLGSLWASHTLVTYPTAREAGLAGNGAVASAVGATVITDTLSLVVLAGVSGSTTGDSSLPVIVGGLLVGLVALVVYTTVVLPRLARWWFDKPARKHPERYAFMLAGLLSSAVLAEMVGIEGLVGAFFAGLGLNRLVHAQDGLLEHTEFFGSAVLVPLFLVSVGLIVDPSVMVQPATLALATVFAAAVIVGKATAALLGRPLLGFTSGESQLVFGLTLSQAAATLAATTVGFQIGLFGSEVVNAVLVVIVVTLLIAAMTTELSVGKVEPAPATAGTTEPCRPTNPERPRRST
jgi:Kef-type K+ transport system membrane component KefB